MKRLLLVLALFTAAFGYNAAAAQAGCVPDAKVVNFDSGNHEEVGHGGMHCTTNNGTSYRLVLYFQFNDGDGWYTTPFGPPTAYNFSNGGNPMPNNYVSGDKVIRVSCSSIHTDTFFPPDIRVHATLTNTVTGTTAVDDSPARIYQQVDSDCP